MKKVFFILSTLTSFFGQAQEIIQPNLQSKTSFAIVVDTETYKQAKNEIVAYQKSVEKDGLGTYIVQHNWKNPEEVKAILYQLYQNKKQPLEGAVFVGNIPITMVRGAQMLTSAFKYAETAKWENSSVASDRFYDDFDLKFDFLKQDENKSRLNYFYYQLKADSPHYVGMDIYSGRIKPAISGKVDDSIDQIKKYLVKLIKVREENNPFNQMISSTGHGYNSNSTIGWGNELMTFRSTFSNLFKQGNSLKFLNYRNSTFLKNQLLTELNREDLDFAYMTGHGTETLQLLNGYPDVSSPQQSMENVGRYIRSKMISAKERKADLELTKTKFQESLGLNDKLFNDAFDAKRAEEDSIYNQNMDIHAEDLKDVNARVAYINSCLTGSFHKKNYIASYYPFSEGKNIVTIANTVGVLQDLWGTQLLGILQNGARTGHLLKQTAFLETHILGDPTFHFTAENATKYNDLFGKQSASKKEWYKLLDQNDADLQSYAIKELTKVEDEKVFSRKLVDIFKNSPFETVRTQAYYQLRTYNNADFQAILPLALFDNYEYIKRKALYDVNDSGSDKFIPQIVDIYVNDQELNRSQYKIGWMFQFFDYDKMIAALNAKLKNNTSVFNAQELLNNALKKVEYEKSKAVKTRAELMKVDFSDKELLSELKSFRLYRHHSMVPDILSIMKNQSKKEEIRIAAAEVLGWFGQSYQKEFILKNMNEALISEKSELVKNQIRKSIQSINDVTKRQF